MTIGGGTGGGKEDEGWVFMDDGDDCRSEVGARDGEAAARIADARTAPVPAPAPAPTPEADGTSASKRVTWHSASAEDMRAATSWGPIDGFGYGDPDFFTKRPGVREWIEANASKPSR